MYSPTRCLGKGRGGVPRIGTACSYSRVPRNDEASSRYSMTRFRTRCSTTRRFGLSCSSVGVCLTSHADATSCAGWPEEPPIHSGARRQRGGTVKPLPFALEVIGRDTECAPGPAWEWGLDRLGGLPDAAASGRRLGGNVPVGPAEELADIGRGAMGCAEGAKRPERGVPSRGPGRSGAERRLD